jgi:transposase
MPVMAVNNENQHEQTGDYRSRPRWSAGKKMDAVLRLLRGEPLEALSRELGVEAHRLAAWRDDFLEGGKQSLKASGRTGLQRIASSEMLSARSAS